MLAIYPDSKHHRTLSLYWQCQLIGWSLASLYWAFQGYISGNFNLAQGLAEYFSDIVVYMLLTHLYRNFAVSRHWQQLNLKQLLWRIIPAIFVMGLAYTAVTLIKLYFYHRWISPHFSQTFALFIMLNGLNMAITGVRLMSIWLLAYHLYHYAQREIRATSENARLELINREAQLNNLSAQLNPHFLFNSLNTIKALIIEQPAAARRAIDLLADLLRTSLYSGDLKLTSVQTELELVNDYLELEKLRLEERLEYNVDAEANLMNVLIPRLSIQTLVENAVKHGVAKQKSGGCICINLSAGRDFIRIVVSNPGTLDKEDPCGGLGLKNLNERLLLQHKGRATLHMEEASGTVVAILNIPMA